MLHQVGVGALGPVFRTYEPTRDRLVAVKVFRLDITPEQAQALADELSVATQAGLFHPSIVEPIGSGVEGSVAYRAEEYVAAESLDVAMRHYAPAAVDKVLPFISQLAAAVDFARLNGVGHGALHPRDIFVTPDEARATGFGVVEALEGVGLRAPVRRPYSAPERVAGGKWGTAADIFSLGALTYELLTGRRPAGVGAAIGDLSGSSVGEHAGKIQAVLARAMEENPASRFSTAMAFASALEGASRGETVQPVVSSGSSRKSQEEDSVPVASGFSRKEPPPTKEPEPAVDDITPEQQDDAAFLALARELRQSAEPQPAPEERDLFDMEAVEDLALPVEAERFKDDFDLSVLDEPRPPERYASTFESEFESERDRDAEISSVRRSERQSPDETEWAAGREPERVKAARRGAGGPAEMDEEEDVRAYTPPPRRSIDYVPDEAYAAAEPPRRRTLPSLVLLLFGLIIGFGAGFGVGYGVGTRGTPGPDATEADAGDTTVPAKPPESGKAYSDQAVTPQQPPSQPPPIPGDAAPPAAPSRGTPSSPPAPSATAPAPAATPTTGRLIVRSVPENAGVTVDGTWRGRTPLTLDKVRLGSYEVRVVQPGYAVAKQSVVLTTNAPARTLSFRLQRAGSAPAAPSARLPPPSAPSPKPPLPSGLPPVAEEPRGPGSLYVDSRPRGAAIFLDGRQVGVTPATIPDVTAGPHVIRLQLLDHRAWTSNTQVLPGQQTRVTGSLERIR